MITPKIKNGNYDFLQFFWYPMSNRLFPNNIWNFRWKKHLKRRSTLFSSDIWDNGLRLKIGKPKIRKTTNISPFQTRQNLKQDAFSLRGQKMFLYFFKQSKLTPRLWISLLWKKFAQKHYFSMIRPTITTAIMTFSSFFGTLCSNRLFPKKTFKIFVEKTFEKAQHTLLLWYIRQWIESEDW